MVISSRAFLAPLCGYTDLAFRLIVRRFGWPGLAWTEMIDPKSVLLGGGRKRESIIEAAPEDIPLVWQVYGNDAEIIIPAAYWLIENRGARLIDINMGCPQKKISGRGAGAGLLRNPQAALRLAETIARALPIPVSVKLRLGPDADTAKVAASLAHDLEEAGVAAITVHARTLAQGYSGAADWHAIGEIVQKVSRIPVIGNGDVRSHESAQAMILQTGCAAVMIGRSALKRPWLLRDVHCSLKGEPIPLPPPRPMLIQGMLGHLDVMSGRHGERAAAILFRRWIPQYAATLQLDRKRMIELLKVNDYKLLKEKIADIESAACTDLRK